jgi:ABC-type uncharacterized transport system YnjBCD ATPase subunit
MGLIRVTSAKREIRVRRIPTIMKTVDQEEVEATGSMVRLGLTFPREMVWAS